MENVGQVANTEGTVQKQILFTLNGGGLQAFVENNKIHYQFSKTDYPEGYEPDERMLKPEERAKNEALRKQIKTATHRFTVSLEGANANAVVRKESKSEYYENYYLAHCTEGVTAHAFEKVVMEDVYPGIDWVLYTDDRKNGLKYDFVVHPGADPSRIKLKITDADKVSMSEKGELVMKTSLGTVTEQQPVSFSNDKKVATRFVQEGDGVLGFALGTYDRGQTLVIDPTLEWATYYGGTIDDIGNALSTDAFGNVYLGGETSSTNAIATTSAYQTTYSGSKDAFLVKFNSSGTRQWATYYGGSNLDRGRALAADGSGNIYLGGSTTSTNSIATIGSHQASFGGGTDNDAFLAKFSEPPLFACPVSGILYVDSSKSTAGDGLSWATAYRTVSQALEHANGSDTSCHLQIWVAKGTYYPMQAWNAVASSRDSSFRIRRGNIQLYGGFSGTETLLSQRNAVTNGTRLSGDIGLANNNADNAYHVVTIVPALNSKMDSTNTIIDGFQILSGNANGTSGFAFGNHNLNRQYRGGVFISADATVQWTNSDMGIKISNCIIQNNSAGRGGGIYLNRPSSAYKDLSVMNRQNVVKNNAAVLGGGLYISHAICESHFCDFTGNSADTGGAVYVITTVNAGGEEDSVKLTKLYLKGIQT